MENLKYLTLEAKPDHVYTPDIINRDGIVLINCPVCGEYVPFTSSYKAKCIIRSF